MLTAFSSQREVFEQTVQPLVDEVLQGYAATAFAYGQTGVLAARAARLGFMVCHSGAPSLQTTQNPHSKNF